MEYSVVINCMRRAFQLFIIVVMLFIGQHSFKKEPTLSTTKTKSPIAFSTLFTAIKTSVAKYAINVEFIVQINVIVYTTCDIYSLFQFSYQHSLDSLNL